MDFIERWLHIAPDGGNGALEVVYLTGAVSATVAVIFRKKLWAFWRHRVHA
jgi:hypothetical protein